MNVDANGKSGFTVAANQRLSFVGSDNAVDSWLVEKESVPAPVSVASVYPYWWLAASYERSKKPILRRPFASYAPQPWNWSPGSSIATGSDHVRPWSNDWLTTMSEFVTAS